MCCGANSLTKVKSEETDKVRILLESKIEKLVGCSGLTAALFSSINPRSPVDLKKDHDNHRHERSFHTSTGTLDL